MTPTGIDRVDTAYAYHLADLHGALHCGLHYGVRAPHAFSPAKVGALAANQLKTWKSNDQSDAGLLLEETEAFLRCEDGDLRQPTRIAAAKRPPQDNRRLALTTWRNRLWRERDIEIPKGAVYLNVAQHFLEVPFFLRWLDSRPDIRPVFFLHDLLPIDYPEYFPAERKIRFPRILSTALKHAKALIVTCEATRERIARHLRDNGHRSIPIHVGPLPADDAFHDIRPVRSSAEKPFVMTIGTVEPRKNHLGLLHLWRRFAEQAVDAPKLLMVGHIGWENEGVIDMLDRCAALRGRVLLVSGLPDSAYRPLLGRARAVLAASFAEGYGIPVVEALTGGTPVIASDIPVFREVTQGLAEFHNPLDGPAWQGAILRLVDKTKAEEARARVSRFSPPTWEGYFDDLISFLHRL